mmetsp:Transcript_35825/g.91511  ORF Transcript_35825/g.91511 Transcript_35825/m.91511 type:complete len:178 (-) Transcript_35825:284-817(-)|eukprot:CAMPEP_0174934140 /NCGR_PEP_ID=MMETSP1355-20121228/48424_1 /TAXON_ID=464990 /ORGANISM="Hemiselmis tepida, Strain CCMP443" /LENGTH=177 /DNA_ID=CAMNT_0016180713 /DNA_START=136 /DNA_END=669 /DNA_ORIENTATION=-
MEAPSLYTPLDAVHGTGGLMSQGVEDVAGAAVRPQDANPDTDLVVALHGTGMSASRGRKEGMRVLDRWIALSFKLSPSIQAIPERRRASLLLRQIQRKETSAPQSRSEPRAGIARTFGAQGVGELRRMFRGLLRELDDGEQQEIRDVLHREALARGMYSYSISLRSKAPVSARAAHW